MFSLCVAINRMVSHASFIFKCYIDGVIILQCIKMIDELTKQMAYLKSMDYGFYGFGVNDILVVDNLFLFCSTQYFQ